MNQGRMNHTVDLGPYSVCWDLHYNNTIVPTPNDILLGRGGNNHLHEGNKRLKQVAQSTLVEYENSEKLEKRPVARRLVEQVYAWHPRGRFLDKHNHVDAWYEVTMERATDKAAQVYVDAVDAMKIKRVLAQEGLDDPTLVPVFRRKRIHTFETSNRSRNNTGSSSSDCPLISVFNRSRVNTDSSWADEDTAGLIAMQMAEGGTFDASGTLGMDMDDPLPY